MVIELLDIDQPTTCPQCGARTEFSDLISNEEHYQLHLCLNPKCKNLFIGEVEKDNEEGHLESLLPT